jgi:hypothetical protein
MLTDAIDRLPADELEHAAVTHTNAAELVVAVTDGPAVVKLVYDVEVVVSLVATAAVRIARSAIAFAPVDAKW